jgi:hypothetical protein
VGGPSPFPLSSPQFFHIKSTTGYVCHATEVSLSIHPRRSVLERVVAPPVGLQRASNAKWKRCDLFAAV